mgnify:CR=1 FL=1|jgi:predicted MFS family arabinose efflux permease
MLFVNGARPEAPTDISHAAGWNRLLLTITVFAGNPLARLSLFYFLWFGSLGVLIPYWTLYLKGRGLSYDVGGAVGSLLSGYTWAHFGPEDTFVISGFFALLGGAVVWATLSGRGEG